MSELVKNRNIYIGLFISLICLFLIDKGYANEINGLELVECTKSSAYLAWENLSEEEKAKTTMPVMCDTEKDSLPYYRFTFDAKGTLPTYYDGRNTQVKNQMNTGQCWAFSATTALESYIKKQDNLTYTFSPRHIEYSSTRLFLNDAINDHGYNRSLGTGGHFYMSSNYLINHFGPIAEKEMPFENNENMINISEIQNKTTLVDVNDIILNYNTVGKKCTTAQIQDIKENIYKNGTVLTTTYIETVNTYYNSTTAAYYYNGTKDINHAITLVGWDDNYSNTNFSSKTRPTSNGAWIVQNSYGTGFGKNGYYYLSYEDVHVCDFYMAIDDLDYEIEDNSYILDKLGYISFMGYVSTDKTVQYKTAYAMNVFTKTNKLEELKEITFGSNGTGNYKIYYMPGKATTSTSISKMIEIGSGRINHAGYNTHKLENGIMIDANVTNFSIAIYYDMDTSTKPIPISVASANKYEYVTTTAGVSFISSNGTSWSDLYSREYDTIASIKAFTNNIDFSLEVEDYNVTYETDAILEIKTQAKSINLNNLKIYIKNSNNDDVSPLTTEYTNGSNLSQIKITLKRPSVNDKYTVLIYYKEEFIDSFTFDIASSDKITSNIYSIDYNNKIIYSTEKTNINTFLNNLLNEKEPVYQSLNIVTTGYIATGMTIENYIIIVKGDVTGDGIVETNDVTKISKYLVRGTGMTEYYYQKAADVTGDGIVETNDVTKISKYLVRGGSL